MTLWTETDIKNEQVNFFPEVQCTVLLHLHQKELLCHNRVCPVGQEPRRAHMKRGASNPEPLDMHLLCLTSEQA